MKIANTAAGLTLIGLFVANTADALTDFVEDAPQSSIDTCLAEVKTNADFAEAGLVKYNVETRERQVSGHTMRIATLVYDAAGEHLMREYAATCAIDDRDEIQYFKFRQK